MYRRLKQNKGRNFYHVFFFLVSNANFLCNRAPSTRRFSKSTVIEAAVFTTTVYVFGLRQVRQHNRPIIMRTGKFRNRKTRVHNITFAEDWNYVRTYAQSRYRIPINTVFKSILTLRRAVRSTNARTRLQLPSVTVVGRCTACARISRDARHNAKIIDTGQNCFCSHDYHCDTSTRMNNNYAPIGAT